MGCRGNRLGLGLNECPPAAPKFPSRSKKGELACGLRAAEAEATTDSSSGSSNRVLTQDGQNQSNPWGTLPRLGALTPGKEVLSTGVAAVRKVSPCQGCAPGGSQGVFGLQCLPQGISHPPTYVLAGKTTPGTESGRWLSACRPGILLRTSQTELHRRDWARASQALQSH